MDFLAKFVTLCLVEAADPWVGALLVSSAAFDRGRCCGVGPKSADKVAEVALRLESRYFVFNPGSNHSFVVAGSTARVALPLAAVFPWIKEGVIASLGPYREEDWKNLLNSDALHASFLA